MHYPLCHLLPHTLPKVGDVRVYCGGPVKIPARTRPLTTGGTIRPEPRFALAHATLAFSHRSEIIVLKASLLLTFWKNALAIHVSSLHRLDWFSCGSPTCPLQP